MLVQSDNMKTREFTVKAVTFDLWETLLFESDGDSNRRNSTRCNDVARAFSNLGLTVSAEQVDAAMKKLIDELLTIWDGNVDISHIEQLELLVKHVSNGSLSLQPKWVQQLSSAYVSPLFEVPPSLNPEAAEALQNLTDSARRIGLICNTGITPGFELGEFLDREGVLDYFDYGAFSDEIGIRKPDVRIFEIVSSNLRVEPDSIVHVGDNEIADVQGAKTAGYRAILFKSDAGRDKIAQADPASLVARSRNLGASQEPQKKPDRSVTSLSSVIGAIEQIEEERSPD